MKARRFAEECRVGAQTLQGVNAPEPTVVMRAGPDGQEVPIKAVKIRHDHQRKVPRSYIILEVGPHYPTEDAYLAACRANHWRAAQLRALGAEPLDLSKLPKDQLTHYPPDDFQWRHGPTRLVTHEDVRNVVHDILIQATDFRGMDGEAIESVAKDIADQLVP